ncbi:hypothetical protein ABEB36_012563 [Hypothenemus hampei]|uniref:Reverse transcriptase domain-containing protein n=1 Tax=Hypothenemus hampei TaxID=57062 RepID=A0ABD1EBN4_HYPHA
MDEVIKSIRNLKGYGMGSRDVRILSYVDDAVLTAENKDNLQRLLFKFNTTTKTLKMKISAAKTKCIITLKKALGCKLVINNKMRQDMKLK